MAAPSGRSGGRAWAALVPAALLCLAARAAAEPGTAPGAASSTAEFDVRPGGEVHSFSRSLGDYSCSFTYSAQGGTNEQWQMTVGASEDSGLFSCSIWRPQGKSYLFFTQFKAEVKGAKIEHAMAYLVGRCEFCDLLDCLSLSPLLPSFLPSCFSLRLLRVP
ncbi:myeloid-derived growth factor isoform X2 [Motacilla alba alba]|uniref:myeloid-derived growth factor isoform X2 n=1 Tax=Motacilla alba alba TaxID=1094192 RepID=UPI0018D595AC|nr:myeloid-derived growth factor isoform X2 [Motacilla alba alba]